MRLQKIVVIHIKKLWFIEISCKIVEISSKIVEKRYGLQKKLARLQKIVVICTKKLRVVENNCDLQTSCSLQKKKCNFQKEAALLSHRTLFKRSCFKLKATVFINNWKLFYTPLKEFTYATPLKLRSNELPRGHLKLFL